LSLFKIERTLKKLFENVFCKNKKGPKFSTFSTFSTILIVGVYVKSCLLDTMPGQIRGVSSLVLIKRLLGYIILIQPNKKFWERVILYWGNTYGIYVFFAKPNNGFREREIRGIRAVFWGRERVGEIAVYRIC
jgi:hypothetical protein